MTSQTSKVAVASGFLPLTINPSVPTNMLQLDLEKALQFNATTEPHAFFWSKMAEWTGLRLQEPNLRVDLSGTWKTPRGQVQLRADQMRWREAQSNSLSLEKLRIALQLDRERAQLTECRLLVQGQPLTLSGELPLGESFWNGLRDRRFPNWDQAAAHLKFDKEICISRPR